MSSDDKRLIEDYLPIESISQEARIENSVTQARGYLSKALLSVLHRWWARRPLVACRAAVYAALVPASQFVPSNGAEQHKKSLGRANAAKFIKALCQRSVSSEALKQAAKHIIAAHSGRPPRVLDMFAGGGSIPLEATRLGCESFALELNPVAHLVEVATLVYPPTFGQVLVDEVERWSQLVHDRARSEVGDLYPSIPDPLMKEADLVQKRQAEFDAIGFETPQGNLRIQGDSLTPVAYLWTRTVPCTRPGCNGTVPLHRQTWLRNKSGGFIAAKPVVTGGKHTVGYDVIHSSAEKSKMAVNEWRFDPADLSIAGEATCPFCHTPVSLKHVKEAGKNSTMNTRLVSVVCTRKGEQGKVYLSPEDLPRQGPDETEVKRRLEAIAADIGVHLYDTKLPPQGALGFRVQPYGFDSWDQLFTPRQLLTLLTFVKHIRATHREMVESGIDPSLGRAVITYVAFILDKIVERSSSVGIWDSTTEKIQRPVSEGKLPMTWDFAESNPFGGGSGSWRQSAKDITGSLKALVADGFKQVNVTRGSAMELPYDDSFFDAVVTDPPYYDNVPYSYLADFFHVWIRRSIGHLYPEHFASTTSPVKAEAVMDPSRHSGNKNAAKEAYESMMARSFAEARRVLKPEAPLICVYAHKTTAGWGTLVEALRKTGFVVTEAWPMDTENPARQRSKESAALATSIFLVARKRETNQKGLYEEVRRDLDTTVRERVGSLWELGISGADLVIACVGAGLHAFTKYATVEYANGEDVPAAKFLAEVEATVLDTILDRLSKQVGGNGGRYSLVGLDAATRFYVLWRYTYKATELDAGEAIVFANGTHVELDGPEGLSAGARTLVEKKKGTYKLRDFSERGDNERLGLPSEHGQASPLVDVLHRILWLMEHHPSEVPVFLRAANPNTEQLRLVAQALSGPALKGGELGEVASGSELAALTKLTANWRSVVEDAAETAVGPLFRATQKNK